MEQQQQFNFSDELMRAILSYCSSVEDLKSFGLTNKRWYHWMFVSSEASDRLFLDLYRHHFHFGASGTVTTGHQQQQGRQLWKNLYHIRLGLQQYPNHSHPPQNNISNNRQRSDSTHATRSSSNRNRRSTNNTITANTSTTPVAAHCVQSINILPREEEKEALWYDHHDVFFDGLQEHQACVGYFGMQPLLNTASVDATADGDATADVGTAGIAIWGDFAGLRIAPHWEVLLNSSTSNDRDQLIQIHDEKQTQVMDFLSSSSSWGDHRSSGWNTDPFFLAFASGVVMVSTTTTTTTTTTPEDTTTSAETATDTDVPKPKRIGLVLDSAAVHDSEITCLAFVPPANNNTTNNNNHHPGCLLSADVSGNVCLYPDSLTRYSLHRQVWLDHHSSINNNNNKPIFTMSATLFAPNRMVLCTAGQGLKVSLWVLEHSSDHNENDNPNSDVNHDDDDGWRVISRTEYDCEELSQVNDLEEEDEEEEEDQVEHSITHASFMGPIMTTKTTTNNSNQNLLVLGTSRGHILSLDLTIRHEEKEPYFYYNHHQPRLELRSCLKNAHAGSVESMTRIGNMILSTGGKDGNVRAMDLVAGTSIASLLVHPGQLCEIRRPHHHHHPTGPRRLKCAVVSAHVCHERQSIICLCRDGHISEWSFQVQTLPSATTTRVKRGAATALATSPKTAKRSRRRRRSNSNNNPSPGEEQSSPSTASPNETRLVASCHSISNSTVQSQSSAAASQEEEDLSSLICSMPESVKDYFQQVGFVKWGKLQRPVLVLSPTRVPPGNIRNAWLKAYHQYQQKNNNKMPPLLVHWYGASDLRRGYSIVSACKFTSYELGIAKRFHIIPANLQKRMDAGLKISNSQQEYSTGLQLLPLEAAKTPMDRSHLFHL